MDTTLTKVTGSPERGSLPLCPVSPSRENRLPTSPSLPSLSPTRHGHERFTLSHARGGSDVQNKVAAFNNLTKEAAQRKRDNEAALQRAMLGREEAESELRRTKEESDALRREVEEGRCRERKVGERLESVMEEYQKARETQTNLQTVYEREVRRARKEAFKSSSALVNLQEELKTARNRYTLMRVQAEDERQKSTAREQEIAAAQQHLMRTEEALKTLRQQSLDGERSSDDSNVHQELETVRKELDELKEQKVAPNVPESANVENELREVSEELFVLQQKLSKSERKIEKVEMQKQVVEEERDMLKKSMEEDQLVKCAAQGAVALPPPAEGARATFSSLRPSSSHDMEPNERDQERTDGVLEEIEAGDDLSQLRDELLIEKRMRLEAEELVHLSLMECQFGCCSCRVAEKQGTAFVHDRSFAKEISELAAGSSRTGKANTAQAAMLERPRSHQGPSRSATPKVAMHQRPRSQQALGRQATPKLLERPHSQQAEGRRVTPRVQLHQRSNTETTFKTARDLDLLARRSISQARSPSTTPAPPRASRQSPERVHDALLKAKDGNKQADANNEEMLEIDYSSPFPQTLVKEDDDTHPILPPPSPEDRQAPSPTVDFNFTEIIPNFPSIPRSLPTPPPPRPQITSSDDIIRQPTTNNDQDGTITASTSTTTRVPTKSDINTFDLFSPAPNTHSIQNTNTPSGGSGGISREEALEQIRARRGRARSYHAANANANAALHTTTTSTSSGGGGVSNGAGAPTPKKAMGTGMGIGLWGTPRREISAPAFRR